MSALIEDVTFFNPLFDLKDRNFDNGLRSQFKCERFEHDSNEKLCLATWHFLLHCLTYKNETVITCVILSDTKNSIPLISKVDDHFTFSHMVSLFSEQLNAVPVNIDGSENKELKDHFTCHAIYLINADKRSVKDVEIALIQSHDGWMIDYDGASYSKDYIAKIVKLWIKISSQVLNDPQLKISNINFVDRTEDEECSELDGPVQNIKGNLLTQFKNIAEKFSDKIAVKDADSSLTYRELDALSSRYAAMLHEYNVHSGDCVGVAFERNVKMVIAQLAVLKVGAAFVPIDAEQPRARLAAIVEDADIKCILTENACLENLSNAITNVNLLSYEKYLTVELKEFNIDISRIQQNDIAYVIFTSGSTGRPKGVKVSHGNLLNFVWHIDMQVQVIEVATQFAPFTFDASVAEIHVTLLHGGTLLILSKALIDNPDALQHYMSEEEVSFAAFPPQYAKHLSPEKLPTLKILLTAGSAPDRKLIQKWQPHVRYINAYGPTETTILSTAWQADRIPNEHEPIAMGFPILNTSVRVINRFGQVLPDGIIGELLIGGEGVAHGYLKQEQLSATRFLKFDNKRWYKSGDLSCFNRNDGLIFVGRADDQIKIRGHRLELGEVESALRTIEGIESVAAIVSKINDEHQLVVFCQGRQLEETQAREKMRQVLPIWAVPNHIYWLNALPVTSNGKVDYKKLKRQLHHLASVSGEHQATFANGLEQQVAEIWQQVLKSRTVSREDNFIHLGGDSLTALVVSSSLRNFGFSISSSKLLTHPVLSEFCQLLEMQTVEIAQDYSVWQGQAKLHPIQAWFFNLNLENPNAFCQSLVFDCEKPLDIKRFEQAVIQLIVYHDQLRAAFPGFSRNASVQAIRQVIGGFLTDWPEIVEQTVAKNELDAVTESLRQSLAEQIDILQAPLFRVAILQTGNSSRVIWVFHHLLMDTISHAILLEDLYLLYSEDANAESVLAGKTTQYAQWSEKLVDHIAQHAEAKLSAWQPVLAASKRAETLQGLNSNCANVELNVHSITVSKDITQDLLKKAPDCYRQSPEELILAAAYLALSRAFSICEFGIDVEWHGRDENFLDTAALDRSVGWFTSVHPLFMQINGELGVAEFLMALKAQRAAIPERGRDFYGLRYLCTNEKVSAAFKDYRQPEVLFNFSGSVQRSQHDWSTLPITAIEMGGGNTNPYKLSIESSIQNGCLEIGLYINDAIWPLDVIRQLQKEFSHAIELIVQHCCNPVHRRWTPSDFPLLALSQQEADLIPTKAMTAFPLTDMQETMLRHEQTYQVWMHYELDRPFHQRKFLSAVSEWIDHNECLRTYIHSWEDGKVAQIVLSNYLVAIEVEKSKPEQRLQAAQAHIEALQHKPVSVRDTPPFSIEIIYSDDAVFSLVLSIHHIIHDGWSIELLLDSLFAFYKKQLGENVVVPRKPFSTMQDVVLEQIKISQEAVWNGYWSSIHWAEHYCQLPESLQYASAAQHSEIELYLDDLSLDIAGELKKHAQSIGVTTNCLLLSGYVLLMRYLGGCHQVRCGVIQSGRSESIADVGKIVGCCVNTLPLVVDFSKDESLLSIIHNVNDLMLKMRESAAFPLSKIYKYAKDKLSGAMFDCLFNIESSGYANAGDKSGVTLQGGYESTNYTFIFGLIEKQLSGEADDKSYGVRIGFDKHKYARDAIAHWVRIYESILNIIVSDSSRPWSRVQPLLAADKEKIALWNNTRRSYPEDICIGQHFAQVAQRTPEKIALKFKDIQLSYAELDARTNKVAKLLASKGVGPEVIVALVAERSLEMVVGILAVLRAGGAYVPIDPNYPEDRVRHMIDDVGCKMVLCQQRHHARVLPADISVDTIFLNELDHYQTQDLADIDSRNHHTRQLAYVMYTSGSTGKPKGAMIEQRSIIRLVKNSQDMQFSHDDTIMLTSAPGFDVTTFEIWSALLNGLTLVVIDEETLLNPEHLAHEIRSKNVTLLWLVAPLFNQLIQEKQDLFEGVKRLMIGGDALSPYHIKLVSKNTPTLQVINGYGPTENTSFSTYHFLTDADSEIIPIGRPISNSTAYIVNKDGHLLPAGVKGELYVGGHGVARGYFNREALTAEKFVKNAFFEDEDKLYRTGDLASWRDNGLIDFHGRIDFQIKIRGFRVELGEIETVILRRASVSQALVIARAVGLQKQLLAYIVPENAKALNQIEKNAYIKDLRTAIANDLPDYMVPEIIIVLAAMPLNANGKIDRARLPNPDELETDETKFSQPENSAEQTLYQIWQDALGHARFGVNDNFYNAGGDSIIAIQVVSRAAQKGLALTMRVLMEHKTIRAIVNAIALPAIHEAKHSGIQTHAKSSVGEQRLLPIQLKLIQDDITDIHHYNQAGVISLPGELSQSQLVSVLTAILKHHSVFSLVFRASAMGWRATYQMLDDNKLAEKVTRLLTVVEPGAQAEQSDTIALFNQLQSSLDPNKGDLCKFALLQGQPNRLFWVTHHLIIDAVSWRIILYDLECLLNLEEAQRGNYQFSKTDSYQDWAAYLYEYAYSDTLLAQKDFWLQQISAPNDVLSFDQDGAIAALEHTTVEHAFNLNEEETQTLLFSANDLYATNTATLLLTALLLALRESAAIRNIRIDLEGHGREPLLADLDLSQTVGWFTTLYPLSFKEIQDDIGRQIQSVKRLYASIPHNGIGFGLLNYITQDEEIVNGFHELGARTSQILFNYLGSMDNNAANPGLDFTMEQCGSMVAGKRMRSHALRINCYVKNGHLKFIIDYSEQQFSFEKIKTLSDHYLSALRKVLTHCVSGQNKLSPGQFALAELSKDDIDHLSRYTDNIQDIYPATAMQEGLLLYSLREPLSGAYHTQLRIMLEKVDSNILYKSWGILAARHDILRTAFFDLQQESLMQVVVSDIEIPWQQITNSDCMDSGKSLDETFEQHRMQAIDIKRAPLWRLLLVDHNDGRFELSWTHHHALLDGWSIAHLLNELLSIYEALSKGQRPLKTASVQFRDYIAWLQTQDHKRAEDYWKSKLGIVDGVTRLYQSNDIKSDANAPAQDALVKSLDATLSRALVRISQEAGVTLSVVMQTAWGLLLSKYSGENNVLFGCSVSGRPPLLDGVEGIAGLFINSLPVVMSFKAEMTLQDVFSEAMASQLANEEYGYVSLAKVQQWLGLNANEIPFESLLVFENYPLDSSAFSTKNDHLPKILSVKGVERNNLPLNIVVYPGDKIEVKVAYSTAMFTASQVESITGHWVNLLNEFSTDINKPISRYGLISAAASKHMLARWNATACDFPVDQSIYTLFSANAASANRDELALVCHDTQLTFKELDAKVSAVSAWLLQQGIKRGDFVAVTFDKDPNFIVAILSILKIGAAYVPIALDCPQARREFINHDADIQFTFTHSGLMEQLAGVAEQKVICIDQCVPCVVDDVKHEKVDQNATAYVIYTSGTTGQPKGVKISHKNLINFCLWCKKANIVISGDAVTQFAPFTFDASAGEIFAALLNGATLHLLTDDLIHNQKKLIDYLHRFSITFSAFPPPYLEQMPIAELPQGMKILTAGSAPTLDLVKKLSAKVRYINGYGPTETTILSTAWEYNAADIIAGHLPIGKPITNTQVYVIDQYKQLCPIDVIGEICIGGEGVSQGYINRDELNKANFIEDVWGASTTLYRTGDLGRWLANGDIEFVGRVDNQIKIRGFRVELNEIESQLLMLPAVKSAVVLALGRDAEKQLFAWLVPQDLQYLERENQAEFLFRIKAALKSHLPGYMIPQGIMILEALPLTANGKIDSKALAQPAMTDLTVVEFIAPATDTEKQLVSLWAKILKLNADNISINADFFALGGHSLLAARLCNVIAEHFDLDIPAAALFEHPTVSALAKYLDRSDGESLSAITPMSREQDLPLSYSQRRLWFITQLDETSAAYNMCGGARITGSLNVKALQQALDIIVERHEVLRSNFINKDGHPVLVVRASATFPLKMETISASTLEGIDDLAKEHLKQESNESFNLTTDSLVRGRLLVIGADTHILLITMHHIVSDGWSMGVFLQEMSTIYAALLNNSTAALNPLPIQYVDYAGWQLEYLQNDVLEKYLNYWRVQLNALPTVHNMPLDYVRPAEQSYRGSQYHVILNTELAQRIRAFAKAKQASLFMVMHAAFSCLLSRYSGEFDIVLGTPIANRDQREVADLIGFFANTLILRMNLQDDPTFKEILQQSKQVTTEAYNHQLLPFDVLVDDLQPGRSLSYNPLFQIMISMITIHEINEFNLQDLSISVIDNATQATAQFDLMLDIIDDDGKIALNWNYATDLFQAQSIERLSRHFVTFVEQVIAKPDTALSEICFLAETERQQLLVEFNDTDKPELITKTWPALFAERLKQSDASQIVASCGDASITLQALEQRSALIAKALNASGLSAGSVVTLLDHRGIDLLVMIVAVIRSGAAYLPLDPTHPTQRWLDILQEAKPDLLIIGNELAIEKRWLTRKWLKEKIVTLASIEETVADSFAPLNYPQLHDTAYVIYTSGSTGRPKGVMIAHQGMINNMLSKFEPFALTERDIIAQTASQCFDISVWQFLIAPILGAKVVIIPNEVTRDPEALLQAIVHNSVTVWEPVPSVMHAILPMQIALDQLRWVIPTGEALTEALVKRWFEQYPNIPLMNAYGPAECSDDVSFEKIEYPTDKVLIGSPVANARLHVVDDYQQLVPIGIVGELAVSGAVVGKGYLNAVDMTEKVFKHNPYAQNSNDQTLYLTGDLVRRLDDGKLQYVGRKDFQVKVRGFRIELGEIEARINTYAGLNDSIVVAIDGPSGDKLLVAYAEKDKRHTGTYPTANDLREYLKDTLPDYMIPSAYILLDEYPLTANGKVDRKALPSPEFSQQSNQVYSAPVGKSEMVLSGIWADVLQVKQVGREDDYFELGGSSLLLVKIITEARKHSLKLTVNDIYQKRTVKACCENLAEDSQDIYQWLQERNIAYQLIEVEDKIQLCVIEKSAECRLNEIKSLINQQGKMQHLPDYVLFEHKTDAVLAPLKAHGIQYLNHASKDVRQDINKIILLSNSFEKIFHQDKVIETFPLTPVQKQMLAWHQRQVKNVINIKGYYSDDELLEAFLKVQNEQDMLRSRLNEKGAYWQLYPAIETSLIPIIDLRYRAKDMQAVLIKKTMDSLADAINKSSILYLACWLRLSDTEQRLCIINDHMIADGLAFEAFKNRLYLYLNGEYKAVNRTYRQYALSLQENTHQENALALKELVDINQLRLVKDQTRKRLKTRKRKPLRVVTLRFVAPENSLMEQAFSTFKQLVMLLLGAQSFNMTLNYHGRQLAGCNDFDQVGLFLDKIPYLVSAGTELQDVNKLINLVAERGMSFVGVNAQKLLGTNDFLPAIEHEILFNFVGEETPENIYSLIDKKDVSNLQGFYGVLFEAYTMEQELYVRAVYRGDNSSVEKLKQQFGEYILDGSIPIASQNGEANNINPEPAIEVRDVKKFYGDFEAVKGVSFTVKKGLCYGILGPNGAGKTSLLAMMEGITAISAGQISILGLDVSAQITKIQPHLGVQLQHSNYFDFLSVSQLLNFYQELRSANGRKSSGYSIDELLQWISLADKKEAKVEELSGGQKQRLSMVIALLEDPDILFLDEPTSALDPHNRRNTWKFIEELKKTGDKTIVLTTHYMEEAERLCDELLIMHEGGIISQGSPKRLIAEMSVYHDMVLELSNNVGLENHLQQCDGVLQCDWDQQENCMRIKAKDINSIIKNIVDYCAEKNVEIKRFDIKRPNLEDVFMHRTTGKELKA